MGTNKIKSKNNKNEHNKIKTSHNSPNTSLMLPEKKEETFNKTFKIALKLAKFQKINKNSNMYIKQLKDIGSKKCDTALNSPKSPLKNHLAIQNMFTMKQPVKKASLDLPYNANNKVISLKKIKQNDELNTVSANKSLIQVDQRKNTYKASSLNDYIILQEIGRGSYAIVYLAVHKSSQKVVALKAYDKNILTTIQRKMSVTREIQILKAMNHPNIVKLNETFETNTHIVLSMEHITGVLLSTLLKSIPNCRLPEIEARIIFKQVLNGVEYCHSQGVAHRDIKLENIIIAEKTVKLIDFGFSTFSRTPTKIKLYCGTPSYMAPEIVQKIEYNGCFSDIWALGVMLYTMLSGCFPFIGSTDAELVENINEGKYVIPIYFSDKVTTFIGEMIKVNPEDRITARDALYDDWILDQK